MRVAPLPQSWPRACPVGLAAFDPSTKVCDHNCGPADGDPRTSKERLYLCDLCGPEGKSA